MKKLLVAFAALLIGLISLPSLAENGRTITLYNGLYICNADSATVDTVFPVFNTFSATYWHLTCSVDSADTNQAIGTYTPIVEISADKSHWKTVTSMGSLTSGGGASQVSQYSAVLTTSATPVISNWLRVTLRKSAGKDTSAVNLSLYIQSAGYISWP